MTSCLLPGPGDRPAPLVRNIRVVRGVMRLAIEIQPRFGYGRTPHQVELSGYGGDSPPAAWS